MDHLQCLITGISDGILCGIINRLIKDNNISIVEEYSNIERLKNIVSSDIDYLIVGIDDNKFPEKYNDILNVNKDLIIIELLDNGRGVALFMNDLNEDVMSKIFNLKVM